MCLGSSSSGSSQVPASPQPIANIPANVLRLGAQAREQLQGQGRGLQSLRINQDNSSVGDIERLKILS